VPKSGALIHCAKATFLGSEDRQPLAIACGDRTRDLQITLFWAPIFRAKTPILHFLLHPYRRNGNFFVDFFLSTYLCFSLDLCREARDLRSKLATERENAARGRESAKEQVKYYKAELDGLDGRLREFQRERDHLLDDLHNAKREIDIGRDAGRRLRAARDEIDALKNRIADAQAKQAAAESEVDRLRAVAYTAPTAEELSKMVSSLQKDIASLKKSRDKHKAAAEGAAAARTTAAEASRMLEESKSQLETVKTRLQTARSDAKNWAAERKAAVEREEELRLFVEISQNLLSLGADGEEGGPANGAIITNNNKNISAAAMKKQITQFLDQQAAVISQRLEAVTKAATAATESVREAELVLQVESLEEERAILTARVELLQKEAEALRAEAAGLREDGEAVLKEVESVSEAYEAAQEENAKLLASIQNRDEENVRLLREAAAATRERSNMVDERNAAVEAARRAEQEADIARRAVEELDARVTALSIELEKARKDSRHLSAQADGAIREAAAARAAVDAATRDAEAARNEAKARAAERDTEAEALRKERTRAERAVADATDLQVRLGRLSSAGGGGGTGGSKGEFSAENAALLKMVNCSVCHARMKDRIITKCNHLFCSHCIDANLNTRHRKCPGCGDRFGVGDVKPFYFT
jgi:E3 ubiquitin-protein ligase BRE1